MHWKDLRILALLFLTLALLAGCSSPTQPPATATSAPTDTPEPPATNTPLPPTATITRVPTLKPTKLPTATQAPANTATPVPTLKPTSVPFEKAIWVYYVNQPTGKKGVCDTTTVPFGIGMPKTGDVENDVATALHRLLSYKNLNYGKYYNPIANLSASIDSVTFDAHTGKLDVALSGAYDTSRNRCDNIQARAQIYNTARQFQGVKETTITLNGASLGDRMTSEGK